MSLSPEKTAAYTVTTGISLVLGAMTGVFSGIVANHHGAGWAFSTVITMGIISNLLTERTIQASSIIDKKSLETVGMGAFLAGGLVAFSLVADDGIDHHYKNLKDDFMGAETHSLSMDMPLDKPIDNMPFLAKLTFA